MKKHLLGSLLALLSCAACNQPAAKQSAAPAAPAPEAQAAAAPAKDTGSFGAPLSSAPATAVSAVLANPAKYDGQDVKLTGTVGGVCQKKGCWMTVGTGEPGKETVRVTFKDYGFFVPRNSLGKQAVVEGRFQVTTLSQKEAQHYAEDAAKEGAPVQKVTEPQKALAMVATGVEIK
jgi:hypothetical protein